MLEYGITFFIRYTQSQKIKCESKYTTLSKRFRNIIERSIIENPNTHKHDRAIPWRGTGTSI